MSIYGKYEDTLEVIRAEMAGRLDQFNKEHLKDTGDTYYEHLASRVKTDESMREKCVRKGVPETTESALTIMKDSIGLRIVCNFIDGIYSCAEFLKGMPDCKVIEEKDYVRNAKPNGYRSYHMILEMEVPYEDVTGNNPGHYFLEIQLRTIAMDTWASLEHEMKYKKSISDQEMMTSELKRLADELASCDIQLQTLRDIIREDD